MGDKPSLQERLEMRHPDGDWREVTPVLGVMAVVFVVGWLLADAVTGMLVTGVILLGYWVIWAFRYFATQFSWEHAAGELDCRLTEHNRLTPFVPVSPAFEIAGEYAGRTVEVAVETQVFRQRTVWKVDCSGVVPDWLRVSPSSVAASADRWLDVDDVKLGHEEFDGRAVVGGKAADEVRAFMWERGLAEGIVEIFEEYEAFEIADGVVRFVESGVARRSSTIRDNVERAVDIADRLAEVAGQRSSEDVTLGDGEVNEEAVGSEEAVTTWE